MTVGSLKKLVCANSLAGLLLAALAAPAQVRRPMPPPPVRSPGFRQEGLPFPATGVLVSGHVTKPTARTVSVSYGPDWRGRFTQTVEAKLSATGDFRLAVPVWPAPAEARLSYGSEAASLYLAPGDALGVSFDAARFGPSLAFGGRGAAANNYLTLADRQATQDDEAGRTPDTQAAALTAAGLREVADAYRQRREAALTAYAAAHPLPEAFVRQQQRALTYEWAGSLLSYYSRQSNTRRQQGYAVVPVGYFDFVRDLHLYAQDSALTQASLNNLLLVYGFTQLNDPNGNLPTGPDASRRLYQRATDALGDGPVRDVAVGQYLLTKVESEHTDIRPLLADFRLHNHDSTIARAVRESVRAHSALTNGQPAPNFTLLDVSGKTVSLSDFKGKVVYLDFWATWCAPCLAEMPASAELRQKFAGRDIVFLYVSLDSRPADWQQYLATKLTATATPNAVQLREGAAFDGAALRAYAVQSIPSYWLIGRDGRIVLNNPPRPSARPASDAALEEALK